MVGFVSSILRVKTIRHAIEALESGGRSRPGKVVVKPTATSKQEIIRPGPTKYFERESHGTSLKENEHEQS
jgi:hypothetical protein